MTHHRRLPDDRVTILGPDEARSLPDGVHPAPAAHLRMGERAARLLLGPHQ